MKSVFTWVTALWLLSALGGCTSGDKAEVARLNRQLGQQQLQISQLRGENDSLRAILSSRGTVFAGNPASPGVVGTSETPAGSVQPTAGGVPEYLSGEIVTANCTRIPVEMFGITPEQNAWWVSTAEVTGRYKDQYSKVRVAEIARIWNLDRQKSSHFGIELRDGRYYELTDAFITSNGLIEFVNTDEVTRQRTNRKQWLNSNVLLISFGGTVTSISWCPKCQRYFPDIYRYCNVCGAVLSERKTPD
ncbi:MAG: hypothetical protein NTX53_05485 [candidate division WOR-3 bacterium]|nr:hypothetical protein [candidate division WOR-3 bacterium]